MESGEALLVSPPAEAPAPADVLRAPRLVPPKRGLHWHDRVELLIFAAVMALSFFTAPFTASGAPNSPLQTSLQGATGGGLCLWKRFLGTDCGGCGMTRAFVQLGHGHLVQALVLNPVSPLVFSWFLVRFLDLLAFNLLARRIDLGWPNALKWKLYGGFAVAFLGLSGVRIGCALVGLPPIL